MNEQGPSLKPLRLEPAGAHDLDSVMDIMNSAFDSRFGEAWTRSQCAGILPMAGVSLVVARTTEAGPSAGFALQRIASDEAELLLIAVRPDERRRGVGQALLDHFLKSSKDKGVARVHLEVRDGNPAVAMYRRAGFSIAGRRRKYYHGSDGSQHDALTLTRTL